MHAPTYLFTHVKRREKYTREGNNSTVCKKEKNTLIKRIRVSNLIARKKEFALEKERVEVGTIALVALQHKICSKLGDKAQLDPCIRRTELQGARYIFEKIKG